MLAMLKLLTKLYLLCNLKEFFSSSSFGETSNQYLLSSISMSDQVR